MSTALESKWFAAVGELEICVITGRYGVNVAHRDFGKGIGMKTAPWMTAALWHELHRELTDGTQYNRDEKRALMDRAIVETHDRLIRAGRLVLK